MDSRVQEHHDRKVDADNVYDELTLEFFEQHNVQIFVVNRSFLVSVSTMNSSEEPNNWSSSTAHTVKSNVLRENVATGTSSIYLFVFLPRRQMCNLRFIL